MLTIVISTTVVVEIKSSTSDRNFWKTISAQNNNTQKYKHIAMYGARPERSVRDSDHRGDTLISNTVVVEIKSSTSDRNFWKTIYAQNKNTQESKYIAMYGARP